MNAAVALLAIHAATTVAMAGLIWFVQIVHYPLFARVGEASFPGYEEAHMRRTTWVVAPLMFAELATAGAIAIEPPAGIPSSAAWAGLGLVGLLWASTAAIQVPCHSRLRAELDPAVVRRLVAGNWLRTAGWTARGGLSLWMLARGAAA